MHHQSSSCPHACSRVQRNERKKMSDLGDRAIWDALLMQAEANRAIPARGLHRKCRSHGAGTARIIVLC